MWCDYLTWCGFDDRENWNSPEPADADRANYQFVPGRTIRNLVTCPFRPIKYSCRSLAMILRFPKNRLESACRRNNIEPELAWGAFRIVPEITSAVSKKLRNILYRYLQLGIPPSTLATWVTSCFRVKSATHSKQPCPVTYVSTLIFNSYTAGDTRNLQTMCSNGTPAIWL